MRLLGDADAAADAVQEALIRAHTHWDKLRDRGAARVWLKRITTNLARDQFKTARVRYEQRVEEMPDVEIEDPDPFDQSEDGARLEDLRRILNAALSELSPSEQRLLWDRHVDGVDYDLLAPKYQRNPGAVKMMAFRARKRLATVLKRYVAEGFGGYEGTRALQATAQRHGFRLDAAIDAEEVAIAMEGIVGAAKVRPRHGGNRPQGRKKRKPRILELPVKPPKPAKEVPDEKTAKRARDPVVADVSRKPGIGRAQRIALARYRRGATEGVREHTCRHCGARQPARRVEPQPRGRGHERSR